MSAQRHNEGPHPAHEAKILPMPPQEVGIEAFLKTEQAEREVKELYKLFDTSPSIVSAVREAINVTLRDKEPNIYSLFLHPDSAAGLTRPELTALYNDNSFINTCMRKTNLMRMNGDLDAARAYRDVLRLSMNMVRYEWLHDVYDGEDERWLERTTRLGDFQGDVVHMHLQPGFNRQTTVKRPQPPASPSDELPLKPTTP